MSNKVAVYLNEHLAGEATTVMADRDSYSVDGSFLHMRPELIVYPRLTNDIRKIARFAWQLAEKGHVLALTARGGGGDDTGGAIGNGVTIDTSRYMDAVFEYDAKQKLVRVQPGARVAGVQNALQLHGARLPELTEYAPTDTVGGAAGYGSLVDSLGEVEVVLASGEVLQTKQLNKRELSKKKGLSGFEGDIYRKLDALIDDNKELIEQELGGSEDVSGYARIRDVKTKQGFNLAPLLAGSQGTLGIVSEMILKAEFIGTHDSVVVAAFKDEAQACTALDAIMKLEPRTCRLIDAEYFTYAASLGKKFEWYEEAVSKSPLAGVVYVEFSEFSARAASKKSRKCVKTLENLGGTCMHEENDATVISQLKTVKEVVSTYTAIPPSGVTAVSVIDGAHIPLHRYNDFVEASRELAKKRHVELPLSYNASNGTVSVRPHLQLSKVSEKQKIFKLLDEYAALVAEHEGALVGPNTNDGRSKTLATYKSMSSELQGLYQSIKEVFDPHGILNPGVKQPADLPALVRRLKS